MRRMLFFLLIASSLPVQYAAEDPRGQGIVVGELKLYDERDLQRMLAELEAHLRSVNAINNTQLSTAQTNLQGTRRDASSLGVTAGFGGRPGETAKFNGQNELQERTLTRNEVKPSIPEPTATTSDFPSGLGFGPNAIDLLNSQVNLQYQVANIRMLLNRAVSDRYTVGEVHGTKQVGTRTLAVVGFEVSIEPPRQYPNSVAEVQIVMRSKRNAPMAKQLEAQTQELNAAQQSAQSGRPTRATVRSSTGNGAGDKPPRVTLVDLIPREKRYNVATLKERNQSMGTGAVIGVFNVGVAGQRSQQSMYIVADSDTVGLDMNRENWEPSPKADRETHNDEYLQFGWQFRPVLGNRFVQPGLRRVFAVLSLPIQTKPLRKFGAVRPSF